MAGPGTGSSATERPVTVLNRVRRRNKPIPRQRRDRSPPSCQDKEHDHQSVRCFSVGGTCVLAMLRIMLNARGTVRDRYTSSGLQALEASAVRLVDACRFALRAVVLEAASKLGKDLASDDGVALASQV